MTITNEVVNNVGVKNLIIKNYYDINQLDQTIRLEVYYDHRLICLLNTNNKFNKYINLMRNNIYNDDKFVMNINELDKLTEFTNNIDREKLGLVSETHYLNTEERDEKNTIHVRQITNEHNQVIKEELDYIINRADDTQKCNITIIYNNIIYEGTCLTRHGFNREYLKLDEADKVTTVVTDYDLINSMIIEQDENNIFNIIKMSVNNQEQYIQISNETFDDFDNNEVRWDAHEFEIDEGDDKLIIHSFINDFLKDDLMFNKTIVNMIKNYSKQYEHNKEVKKKVKENLEMLEETLPNNQVEINSIFALKNKELVKRLTINLDSGGAGIRHEDGKLIVEFVEGELTIR